MKKVFMNKVFLAIVVILITSGPSLMVWGLGPLTNTPGNIIPQSAIQQCTPTGTFNKDLGTGGGGGGHPLFSNISTASLACLDAQGITGTTAVPVAAAIKYRYGGFATGHEQDYNILPSGGGKLWVGYGVTKIGFQAISSTTATTRIIGGKQ